MTIGWKRGAQSLGAGALAGGAAVAMEGALYALVAPVFAGEAGAPIVILTYIGMIAVLALLAGIYAAVVFGLGLVLVGLPTWALLHWAGLRSRGAAVAAGVILAPTAVGLPALIGGAAYLVTGWLALLLILPGAFAGWTLHRVAYGKSAKA